MQRAVYLSMERSRHPAKRTCNPLQFGAACNSNPKTMRWTILPRLPQAQPTTHYCLTLNVINRRWTWLRRLASTLSSHCLLQPSPPILQVSTLHFSWSCMPRCSRYFSLLYMLGHLNQTGRSSNFSDGVQLLGERKSVFEQYKDNLHASSSHDENSKNNTGKLGVHGRCNSVKSFQQGSMASMADQELNDDEDFQSPRKSLKTTKFQKIDSLDVLLRLFHHHFQTFCVSLPWNHMIVLFAFFFVCAAIHEEGQQRCNKKQKCE